MESLYITDNATGAVIIEKHFKKPSFSSSALLSQWWTSRQSNVVKVNLYTLLSLEHNGLFIVAVVSQEIAPIGVFYLLVQLVQVFQEYFGSLSESVLTQNFDTVYQVLILEDSVDDGKPYITEVAILKQLVPPPSLLNTMISAVSIGQTPGPTSTGMASRYPWRPNGLKYAHNEIFFDVVEELDCIIDGSGYMVCSNVIGQIECLSRLSGVPELVLSLGGRKLLASGSVSFHPCVSVSNWEKENTLTFIPPDGQFVLLEYTLDVTLQQLPVIVKPTLKKTSSGASKLDIRVSPRLGNEKSFEYLTVSVKLPNVASVHSNTTIGTCEYDPVQCQLVWNIGALSLKSLEKQPFASLTLSDPIADSVQIEYHCSFRVNMHCLSGIRIDGLSIHNEAYMPFKGGRSYVKSGRVVFRS
ncbi:AP-3 complex subunit mu-1 [Kappamyces sp. JEL0829]|nr:AP-3 complex subunit mu-1 [Kappamyces sp. JEL0829]